MASAGSVVQGMAFGCSSCFDQCHDVQEVSLVDDLLPCLALCFKLFDGRRWRNTSYTCLVWWNPFAIFIIFVFVYFRHQATSWLGFCSSAESWDWYLSLVVQQVIAIIKIDLQRWHSQFGFFVLLSQNFINRPWTHTPCLASTIEKLWWSKKSMRLSTSGLAIHEDRAVVPFLESTYQWWHYFALNFQLTVILANDLSKWTKIDIVYADGTILPLIFIRHSILCSRTWFYSNGAIEVKFLCFGERFHYNKYKCTFKL